MKTATAVKPVLAVLVCLVVVASPLSAQTLVDPGDFEVYVGSSSVDGLRGECTLG